VGQIDSFSAAVTRLRRSPAGMLQSNATNIFSDIEVVDQVEVLNTKPIPSRRRSQLRL
jgi:hypothetical protein